MKVIHSMKTFGDLTIKDILYTENGRPIEIAAVSHESAKSRISLKTSYQCHQDIDPSKTCQKLRLDNSSYISYHHVFTTKSEAEFCKKDALMDMFNKLKDEASKAIDIVVKFREDHFDELCDLSTREILKRKRENLII